MEQAWSIFQGYITWPKRELIRDFKIQQRDGNENVA